MGELYMLLSHESVLGYILHRVFNIPIPGVQWKLIHATLFALLQFLNFVPGFFQVVAKRYQKDGMLQLDGSEDAIGKAPGHLKSLDLRGSTYVGYVPGDTKR